MVLVGVLLIIIGDGTAATVQLLGNCVAGGNFELSVLGDQVFNVSPGSDLIIGPNDDITIIPGGDISVGSVIQFGNNIKDFNGANGLNDSMLVSLPGAGTGVFWKNPADNQFIGYKSFQTFTWTNGNPVAYTNWINGAGSTLPHLRITLGRVLIPLVEQPVNKQPLL
jgi:hypothetical protein